jgi:hypothetical protein
VAVRGLLSQFGGDDDLGLAVGGNLRVVSLHEALACIVFHNSRVRIDEVILPGGRFGVLLGALPPSGGLGRARRFRDLLFARTAAFAGRVLPLDGGKFPLRFALQFGLGLADPFEPALGVGQLLRQGLGRGALGALAVLGLVGLFGFGEQLRHHLLPVLFALAQLGVRRRAAGAGVGQDLRAVDRHVA